MVLSFDLSYGFLASPYNVLLQCLLAMVIAYFLLKRGKRAGARQQPKLRVCSPSSCVALHGVFSMFMLCDDVCGMLRVHCVLRAHCALRVA